MLTQVPGAIELTRSWFEHYKGPGAFTFHGYAEQDEAVELIERHYREWQELQGIQNH